MNNLNQHEHFAQMSMGISDNSIHSAIIDCLKKYTQNNNKKILDVGCGEGNLLRRVQKELSQSNLTGMDILQYDDNFEFNFVKHNLNESTKNISETFDIILATEVIEHLENPRLFLREISKLLNPDGYFILSTPNLYSFLSLLSFWLKGYHSSFGPKNYPAHITPIAEWDLKNIALETNRLAHQQTIYVNNGRIPGTSKRWSSFFPFLKGKRFSDNYICIFKKIS